MKKSYAYITDVAMYIDGQIESLPAPNRHADIMEKFPLSEHEYGEEGFLDGYGNFLSRVEAMDRAKKMGQVKLEEPRTMLNSQHVW